MKIGFVSLDHLRSWTGITRLIDRIAQAMTVRGHEVVIIACAVGATCGRPSELNYPHELIEINTDSETGIAEARGKLMASGINICAASIGSSQLSLMPKLFRGTGIPWVHGEPADPRVFVYERWNPYVHYGTIYSCAAVQVLLKEYVPYYPLPLQSRMTVIGNPAQPPEKVDFSHRREKDTRTIIAVGRFNEEDKRFSVLMRAFALLTNDFPNWRLKLVGDGSFMEYYKIMAEQLGLCRGRTPGRPELIIFTGAVSNPSEHYNSADIFCLPSFRAEGLPMVFGEAAAHALPFVGFSSCTASKALITDETGVLAEENTIEALSEALRHLMALSPEKREDLGKAAQRLFQEQYSEDIIFDKWEKLLMDTFENWKGLEPDSEIWTDELLSNISSEVLNENTEIVRLQCELAEMKRNYDTLEKRYTALLGQFQNAAMRKKKR
ncbi:MAG: glycosyltransferase [Oscillospiraceae bacterium]|nr:glycosyltransferase [Oscillospiraceae bacterium]